MQRGRRHPASISRIQSCSPLNPSVSLYMFSRVASHSTLFPVNPHTYSNLLIVSQS